MSNKKSKITILGDSTIDNKIWVSPGPKTNAILDNLHLNWGFRKLKKLSPNAEYSIIENLKKNLPNHNIRDYSNDGFTTSDCLNGQYKDKVFPEVVLPVIGKIHSFPATFPHKMFAPLNDNSVKKDIAESQHIILSIGGNNVREFLQHAVCKLGGERKEFIKNEFPNLLKKLQAEYIEIFNKLRSSNKDAQIILLTQYYPSFIQNDYRIYEFLTEVGEALGIGGQDHNPKDVIQKIIQDTYSSVFSSIKTDNVVVADLTSSINPFEVYNHSHQIEPSGSGGKKIAKMLSYLINNNPSSGIYSFKPSFFREDNVFTNDIEKVDFNNWNPKHPNEFSNEAQEFSGLISELDKLQKQYQFTNPQLHKSCEKVLLESNRLLGKIRDDEEYDQLKKSIKLSINVLKNPQNKASISQLKNHAECIRGKSNIMQKLAGALLALVGVAIITLSVCGIPFSGGTSAIGCYVGGSILTTSGIGLFAHGRQKGLSRRLSSLAHSAEKKDKAHDAKVPLLTHR